MNVADRWFAPDFGKVLALRNGLSEQRFLQWAFHPGMLFHSREKWWGDRGRRQRPHEGLDIAFYLDPLRNTVPIPNRAVVPVMFPGEVLAFGEDDYFGVTLYVKHPASRDRGRVLCTIYGHVAPLRDLYPGKTVGAGVDIATISDFGTPKSGIAAHLHLSVAWIVESFTGETMTWNTINDSEQVRLIDPMPFFSDSFSLSGGNDPMPRGDRC